MKPTKARSCTGKRAHTDHQAAMNHIFRLKRADGAVRMWPYHCKFCQKWHVGHRRGRK